MNEMDEYLRQDIAEHYDVGCWDKITGIIWENGTRWQLVKFERDVEYHGFVWRCLIIAKLVYDPDEYEEIVDDEDIFSSAFELYPIEGSPYNQINAVISDPNTEWNELNDEDNAHISDLLEGCGCSDTDIPMDDEEMTSIRDWLADNAYDKYASDVKYGYEYEYKGKLHVLFSVKSFNGSVWNRFDRSAITPSGNNDGLWDLVLVPSDNIGNPVVFRDGLYCEQVAKGCQEDLHKYLAEFFRRW